MTLREINGFDNLDTGNPITSLQDRWNHSQAASGISTSTFTPFNRGNSILLESDAEEIRYFLNENLGVNDILSGVVGFHFHSDSLENDTSENIIECWGTGNNPEWSIHPNTHGNLVIQVGFADQKTSDLTLQNNTWYYLEIKYWVTGSVPSNNGFQVNVDGFNWVSLDGGTDTTSTPDPAVRYFLWGGADNANRYIDDVYFLDLTGIAPSSFLGPSLVHTLFPTGDGATINFVGSDGNQINNFQQVDETSPDEDTTFNSISSDGIDHYRFPNLSGTVSQVHGVELCSRARTNQVSPTRGWANSAFVSGVNYDQPSGNITGLTYSYFSDVLGRNPDTNGEWTQSAVENAEFGVKYTT